ncbi:type II restriction-modification system DNA adenine-specific methylase [Candidatus Protofrankia californiensis]|uniref:Type II restriction-modification system DNA adenine-specific methylase n=1 Tax=Candidatus Protofrankia californiensis TaxID=1839754 RepID=A0A1C3NWC1_9ACTN|nr:type II restriction-modification system DNA adenine-specific methylase [Candidatus Protofrankia californiensis]
MATAGQTETGTQAVEAAAWPSAGRPDEPAAPEPAVTSLAAGDLLARVIASLLPPSTTAGIEERPVDGLDDALPVVLDPACAAGTLLTAVADRFGDRVRLLGQEIDVPAAESAALNLRGHPLAGPGEIRAGDSLRDNRFGEFLGRASAVVCEPPANQSGWPVEELMTDRRWEFGIPAPRDGELVWVQHCYAHLRPRGTAVVAVPPRACVAPSGQPVREALVRAGALRAVIALPPGMSSLPGADVCLWVLRRPYGDVEDAAVTMIDLSGVADMADVPQQFAVWRRLFEQAVGGSPGPAGPGGGTGARAGAGRGRPGPADAGGPAVSRAVPRLRLLDGDTNLLPSRYVTIRAEASADDLARVTSRLQALYARVGQGLPRFAPAASQAQPQRAYVTIGELERVGALTIRSRETTPRPGDVLLRTLGRPPAVATGTDADDAGVAQVVELDPARLDAHFVATFLRADANALPVANTLGALSREDLRRCRIPRMPLAEQRRYGDEFRRLGELRDALSGLARLTATVIDQTVHGLTTGTLAPRGPDR